MRVYTISFSSPKAPAEPNPALANRRLMNVLVVSSKYPPEYAGSGFRAHNTYKRLSHKYGVSFDVVASSVTSNSSRDYSVDGVSVKLIANKYPKRVEPRESETALHRTKRRALNKLFWHRSYWQEALPMLLYLVRNSSKFDVLHVFGNVTVTSAAISYAKITGKPVIVEIVNMVDNPTPYEPRLASLMFGRGFPRHALLVCLSEHLRQACVNHGVDEKQIWCRPNPVDETRFNYASDGKEAYRRELPGLGMSDIVLLHLAKIMPRKHQLFMVEVMSHLPDHFKLVLAGPLVDSGPMRERDQAYYRSILKAVHARNLESRVRTIPEFIDRPEIYMKAADVFAMPVTGEALGTPFLEAIACGVPVVANDLAGVFDQWIKPGANGYICELDAKKWAEQVTLAAAIDHGRLEQSSREILNAASTEVIDQKYWDALRRVAA